MINYCNYVCDRQFESHVKGILSLYKSSDELVSKNSRNHVLYRYYTIAAADRIVSLYSCFVLYILGILVISTPTAHNVVNILHIIVKNAFLST